MQFLPLKFNWTHVYVVVNSKKIFCNSLSIGAFTLLLHTFTSMGYFWLNYTIKDKSLQTFHNRHFCDRIPWKIGDCTNIFADKIASYNQLYVCHCFVYVFVFFFFRFSSFVLYQSVFMYACISFIIIKSGVSSRGRLIKEYVFARNDDGWHVFIEESLWRNIMPCTTPRWSALLQFAWFFHFEDNKVGYKWVINTSSNNYHTF